MTRQAWLRVSVGEGSRMAWLTPGWLGWDNTASEETAADAGMSGEAVPGSAPPDPVRQVSVAPLLAGPSNLSLTFGPSRVSRRPGYVASVDCNLTLLGRASGCSSPAALMPPSR